MKKIKNFLLVAMMLATTIVAQAATLKGKVVDSETGEPLLGATVFVLETNQGTTTDLDGNFELKMGRGQVKLEISYISYVTQVLDLDFSNKTPELLIKLATDSQTISEVVVSTRVSNETEVALQNERIASNVAIENLGVREMSLKGLSNAEDGVKKMTGISVADAGQVFVRGLGDRYSLTTLNGIPVASPNPDNKLIPLDVFPSSAIQNITVSKVYRVDAFADYAGALIDVSTRDIVYDDFFNFSFSVGGNSATTGGEFFQPDRDGSLFNTSQIPAGLDDTWGSVKFREWVKSENRFATDFSIDKNTSLPVFGGQLGFGKKWEFGENVLSVLGSLSISNDQQTIKDAFLTTLNSEGGVVVRDDYDSYKTSLETSGLGSIGYNFGGDQYLNYTVFYARNIEESYKSRFFNDDNESDIYGNNSSTHAYSLINHQLTGDHAINDRLSIDWTAVYSLTESDEPDRRQSLFRKDDNGEFIFYTKNDYNTMRYFATLTETQAVGDLAVNYKFGEDLENLFTIGGAYRAKDRDYESAQFYYDMKGVKDKVEDIHSLNDYINQSNIADGTIGMILTAPTSGSYYANSSVAALFAQVDYNIGNMLVNAGLRVEDAYQEVTYWELGDNLSNSRLSDLGKLDYFPAVNFRYSLRDKNSIRLSLSKSVTRPSFIEMAPFLYEESYGSLSVKGNGELENGYNYNVDLRYETFAETGTDMFSVTAYYKYLESPIERVQADAGGSTIYTFFNSDGDGTAAGIEVEARKELLKNLKLGVNASYIYTHVVLEEGGGIYTDLERELQGASPYLVNVDLTYSLTTPSDKSINFALLYNLQGPRIDAVGVNDLNSIIQEDINTLNFVCSYKLNDKVSFKAEVNNLLNTEYRYTQKVRATGKEVDVASYRMGIDASVGVSINF